MKKLLFLFFITCFSKTYSQNQNEKAIKLGSILFEDTDFLGYDAFGFYYTLKNDVFSKTGKQAALEYKNIALGKITKIDLQNPLKMLLFYSNFNTIVVLDNQLNEIQKINFSENRDPIVVGAMGLASQNQFWVYNNMSQQLGLYDYFKKEYKSITVPFQDTIQHYNSNFNHFYWIDSKNKWYSCDIFGKINFIAPIPDYDCIEIISDKHYLYSKSGVLLLRDIEKNESYEIKILEKSWNKFYYREQILSIFTTQGITNYKISIP